jgi:hypothetical protein
MAVAAISNLREFILTPLAKFHKNQAKMSRLLHGGKIRKDECDCPTDKKMA